MSTEFTIDKKIPFEEILKCPLLIFEDPPEAVYNRPHKLMRRADGTPGTLWVYQEGDSVEFERFGKQDPTILQIIIDYFGVKVTDYCGLDWPRESGG